MLEVIFVNHKNWLNKNVYGDLLNSIEKIKEKLEFWDQDVLNFSLTVILLK